MTSFCFKYANEDRNECKCHIKVEIQELKKYIITILVYERNEGILYIFTVDSQLRDFRFYN